VARVRADPTQEHIAALAQVAVSTVRKIETGAVVEPGYFTVMALMGVLSPSSDEPGA
jgi:hypothetical protein